MKRFLRLFAGPLVLAGLSMAASAQAPAADPVLTEVRSLKRLVELQNKEINGLADQVARLRQQLEAHEKPAPEPPPPGPEAAPPPPGVEPPPPGDASAHGEAGHAEAAHAEPPRAEPTGAGVKHIVAKGETLTSIAKHYNVPLTELQKANKGLEARKMQIGQVLLIPASAAPAPEAPAPTH